MTAKMDQMSPLLVHKDDVQQINFNVEIKIVHRFRMFVMVKYRQISRENMFIPRFVLKAWTIVVIIQVGISRKFDL